VVGSSPTGPTDILACFVDQLLGFILPIFGALRCSVIHGIRKLSLAHEDIQPCLSTSLEYFNS
ncbi:MAG TPA: hypothetical protein DGH68_09065, partial [Bacteroidetes bacterium]|nr:hypothetical protein [Bacteroidota bacterium]